jgi:hypothetical protein
MGTIITVVANDYGYLLSFTLQDSQGNVFNLTGASSLYFRTQMVGNSSINSSGTMSVISATSGTCSYTVAKTDFTVAGLYNAQIEVNFSGQTISWSNLQITVLPEVPF